MSEKKVLAINPGSTTTKLAVYEGEKLFWEIKINHSPDELIHFSNVLEQFDFRKDIIVKALEEANFDLKELNAVVGRGGLLRPMESGVYRVNDAMMRDYYKPMGNHISNLGTALAKEIAGLAGKDVPAFITDPTCVDEFEDVARLTGLPEIPRKSLIHALNQKAVARRYARENGKNYEEVNVIVPHMGSGITIGAHKKGRIIDNTNGLSEGPLTPERAGALPAVELVDLCFSGEHTKAEIMKKLYGKGGMMAYLGTNDVLEVQKKAKNGDEKAALVLDAMIYQTAKYIGAMGTVLKGEVDAIIITGSIAYNEEITNAVIERVKHIAPVVIYPGEDEMETLAMNGLMVLNGEIEETVYE